MLHWLAFLAASWAASVEVFLRSQFGKNYLGSKSAAVLLLVPLYCTFCSPHDIRPMFWFLAAFLVMSFLRRLGVLKRHWAGNRGGHTR